MFSKTTVKFTEALRCGRIYLNSRKEVVKTTKNDKVNITTFGAYKSIVEVKIIRGLASSPSLTRAKRNWEITFSVLPGLQVCK